MTLIDVDLARGAATARAINVFHPNRDTTPTVQESHWLLARVEDALQAGPGRWLAGDYPGVRGRLARVEGLAGFVPMVRTAVGLRTNG